MRIARKWLVCAHWTYGTAHLNGHTGREWMVHSVLVIQRRESVLGHMCTEAVTFRSARRLKDNSYHVAILQRSPVSDTCEKIRHIETRHTDAGHAEIVRTAKATQGCGTQVDSGLVCSLPSCVDPERGSAHRMATSRLTSSRSARRSVTHTQSGSGRGSGYVFENIGAVAMLACWFSLR